MPPISMPIMHILIQYDKSIPTLLIFSQLVSKDPTLTPTPHPEKIVVSFDRLVNDRKQ